MDGEIIYPAGANVALLEGGNVVPVGAKQLSPSEITASIKNILSWQYEGKDADKIGMTLIDAAIFSACKKAADGDLDAFEKLMNRLMGRPVQAVVSATGTLREFLDGIAKSEPGPQRDPNPFDD